MPRHVQSCLISLCLAGAAGADTSADEDRLINRLERTDFEVVEARGFCRDAFSRSTK